MRHTKSLLLIMMLAVIFYQQMLLEETTQYMEMIWQAFDACVETKHQIKRGLI